MYTPGDGYGYCTAYAGNTVVDAGAIFGAAMSKDDTSALGSCAAGYSSYSLDSEACSGTTVMLTATGALYQTVGLSAITAAMVLANM